MLPDWQLPPGVDRGLWDYLRAGDMVAGYDAQMQASPLARADVAFCERAFPTPGRLIDLGCGTGRLCVHFAARGYECVGVDLSEPMLAQARANAAAAGVGSGGRDTADVAPPHPAASPRPSPPGGRGWEAPARSQSSPPPEVLSEGPVSPHPLPPGGEGRGEARGVRGRATPDENQPSPQRGSATFISGNLVELADLPDGSFDYAACLFSTLGMVRGADHRAKVVANAARLLKPGGRFVLHVHNRFFRGLGRGVVRRQIVRTLLGRPDAGDVTMPQAYGGAPLTLHHFARRGAVRLLTDAGFAVREVRAVGVDGEAARGWRAYGYLLLAERTGGLSEPGA